MYAGSPLTEESSHADEDFRTNSAPGPGDDLGECLHPHEGPGGRDFPHSDCRGTSRALVLGPGDIRVAHQKGEFVPLSQLEDCADFLHQAIEEFCT